MAQQAETPRPFDEVLAVEPVGRDAFTTSLLGFDGRSFGGETLGCAVLAASRTCDGRSLHSLHACFLRPLPPEEPIELRVERVSDGRRIARRRVVVRRDDRLLFELMASFAAPGQGAAFQAGLREPRPVALAAPAAALAGLAAPGERDRCRLRGTRPGAPHPLRGRRPARRLHGPGGAHPGRLSRCRAFSRSTNFVTLPDALVGSASTTWTKRGTL